MGGEVLKKNEKPRRFRPRKFLRKVLGRRGGKSKTIKTQVTEDTSVHTYEPPRPEKMDSSLTSHSTKAYSERIVLQLERTQSTSGSKTPTEIVDNVNEWVSFPDRARSFGEVPFDETSSAADDFQRSCTSLDKSAGSYSAAASEHFGYDSLKHQDLEEPAPLPDGVDAEFTTDLFEVERNSNGEVVIGVSQDPKHSPVTISVVPDESPKKIIETSVELEAPPKSRSTPDRQKDSVNPVRRFATFTLGLKKDQRKSSDRELMTTGSNAEQIVDDLERQEKILQDVKQEPSSKPVLAVDDAAQEQVSAMLDSMGTTIETDADVCVPPDDEAIDEGLEVEYTDNNESVLLHEDEPFGEAPSPSKKAIENQDFGDYMNSQDDDADTTFDLEDSDQGDKSGTYVEQSEQLIVEEEKKTDDIDAELTLAAERAIESASPKTEIYHPPALKKRKETTNRQLQPSDSKETYGIPQISPRKYAGRSRESVVAEETHGSLRDLPSPSTPKTASTMDDGFQVEEMVEFPTINEEGPLERSEHKQFTPKPKINKKVRTPRTPKERLRTPRESTGKKARRFRTPRSVSTRKSRRSMGSSVGSPNSMDSSYYSESTGYYYDDETEVDTLEQIGTELKEMASELKERGPRVIIEWLNPTR